MTGRIKGFLLSTGHRKTKRHAKRMLLCFVVACLLLSACRNDMEKVRLFEKQELPQQTLDSVHVLRSENARLQMSMTASKVVIYETPEKKTVYPEGLNLQLFDNSMQSVAVIMANYAVSLDEKKIVELRDSVVIIDFRSGDTSFLETLVWNSADHRIFSNKPVKSVNGQRVTYGDGFDSDDSFEHPLIIRQRGTIEVND